MSFRRVLGPVNMPQPASEPSQSFEKERIEDLVWRCAHTMPALMCVWNPVSDMLICCLRTFFLTGRPFILAGSGSLSQPQGVAMASQQSCTRAR